MFVVCSGFRDWVCEEMVVFVIMFNSDTSVL